MGRTVQVTTTTAYRNLLAVIEAQLLTNNKPALLRNLNGFKLASNEANPAGSKIYWNRGNTGTEANKLLPEEEKDFGGGTSSNRESLADVYFKGSANGLLLDVTVEY